MPTQDETLLYNNYLNDFIKTENSQEAKKHFRELILKWHPDKMLDNKEEAERQFIALKAAYKTYNEGISRSFGASKTKSSENDKDNLFADESSFPPEIEALFRDSERLKRFAAWEDDLKIEGKKVSVKDKLSSHIDPSSINEYSIPKQMKPNALYHDQSHCVGFKVGNEGEKANAYLVHDPVFGVSSVGLPKNASPLQHRECALAELVANNTLYGMSFDSTRKGLPEEYEKERHQLCRYLNLKASYSDPLSPEKTEEIINKKSDQQTYISEKDMERNLGVKGGKMNEVERKEFRESLSPKFRDELDKFEAKAEKLKSYLHEQRPDKNKLHAAEEKQQIEGSKEHHPTPFNTRPSTPRPK